MLIVQVHFRLPKERYKQKSYCAPLGLIDVIIVKFLNTNKTYSDSAAHNHNLLQLVSISKFAILLSHTGFI
jgi:hypothetical protein